MGASAKTEFQIDMIETQPSPKPPKWADILLKWYCSDYYLEEVQGDLHEWFYLRVERQGLRLARFMYILDVIRYFRTFRLRAKTTISQNSNYISMKQILKLTYRNARKDRFSAFLKILNLTMGLAIFLLALTYTRYELSYDEHHDNAENIFRVGQAPDGNPWAATPMGLGGYMKENLSSVQEMTRFFRIFSTWIKKDDKIFTEKRGFYAESTVFDLFKHEVVVGDLSTALVPPDAIVLTRSLAMKYFGRTDVVGELLRLEVDDTESRRVTAVIEDLTEQTHLKYDYLLPLSVFSDRFRSAWRNWATYTYVRLNDGTDFNELSATVLKEYKKQYNVPEEEDGMEVVFTGVKDIHLYTNHEKEIADNGNISYVYILLSIGIFVLLISSINFINVSVVKGFDRAKEVALRKTVGASRQSVILQFMGESMIILLVSAFFSLIILALVSPVFGNFSGLNIPLSVLEHQEILIPLAIIILLLEIICGAYPAIVLSRFKPSSVLKSGNTTKFSAGGLGMMRKGLIVFQFVISMILMVSSFVIYNQLDHIQKENLGFEKDQILLIELNSSLRQKYDAFVSGLSTITGVQSVTGSSSIPSNRIMFEGVQEIGGTEEIGTRILMTDENFADTYGLELLAGPGFMKNTPDAPIQYMLNESAATLIFGERDPVNQKIRWGRDTGNVVAVVKDFNFQSLHNEVEPLVISSNRRASWLSLRFSPAAVETVTSGIERVSLDIFPDLPSIEYQFLSDRFANMYINESRLKAIVWIFCIISIVLTISGIFGMATYMAKQRMKEIAIRKVLGSEVSALLKLLSREFVFLLIVALLLAVPLGIYLSDWWLQGFANRISVGPAVYLISVLSIVLFVLGSSSYVTLKAAGLNPVDALKND